MPRQGAVTRDGKGESIAGMVIMLKGENGRDVGARVKQCIAEVTPTLPSGVRIVPFYDQTEVIERTAATVRRNLLEGSGLVILVLVLFLGDLRAALLAAAVIPLSMLIAFIGMNIFGISANLMSLGAIDFGMIVDGAVVMMENSIRRLEHRGPNPLHPEEEIRSAAMEVGRPIVFAVAIIIAVFLFAHRATAVRLVLLAVALLHAFGHKLQPLLDLRQGFFVGGNSPAEYRAFIEREIPKWGRIVKEANVRVE